MLPWLLLYLQVDLHWDQKYWENTYQMNYRKMEKTWFTNFYRAFCHKQGNCFRIPVSNNYTPSKNHTLDLSYYTLLHGFLQTTLLSIPGAGVWYTYSGKSLPSTRLTSVTAK